VLDLHTHAYERSRDSGASSDALAQAAAARGLDGICLTDHNAVCSEAEAGALAEQHGVAVIPGMEVGTDTGHVLVFGLDRFHPELVHVEQLRRICLAEGAVMVWAHPMRELHLPRPDWDDLPRLFDALEVLNGDHTDGVEDYFAGLADRLALGRTGGSDAHSIQAIGRVATAFEGNVCDLTSLRHALRGGAYHAVDFRVPASPRSIGPRE
jgi:predicted metal-dependent phosphoesterase TrpH